MNSVNWQTYSSPEFNPKNARNLTLSSKLKGIWQRAIAHLEVTSEPRVWQTQGESGSYGWSAYDPATKQSIQHVTERQMREWLEERHYQYSAS